MNAGYVRDLSKLTEPVTRSHGSAVRAFNRGVDTLGGRALMVELVFDTRVVRMAVVNRTRDA